MIQPQDSSLSIHENANELQNKVTYHIISKALILAVKGGLSERLSSTPITIEQLASHFGYEPQAAQRFFKLLETLDLLKITEENLIISTELTSHLHKICSEHYFGSYSVFNHFEFSLKDNIECWSNVFGKPFYGYLEEHPRKAKEFQTYLETTADSWLDFIPSRFDFSKYENIVDVGGGEGQLLTKILGKNQYKKNKGILFEKSDVIHGASFYIAQKKLAHKIILTEGDFLKDPLPDGDIYIFCRIFLNWNDEYATKIIKNCLKKVTDNQKIIIIDFIVPHKTHKHYQRAVLHDLNLLAVFGGKIRTTEEWNGLIKKVTGKKPILHIIDEENYPNINVPMAIIEI